MTRATPCIMNAQNAVMAAPTQKPETFMLSPEAQQALPHDAQVALQQVDNCESQSCMHGLAINGSLTAVQ